MNFQQSLKSILILGFFSTAFLAGWPIQPVCAQEQPDPLRYRVNLADAKNHYVHIEMTVPVTGAETELMMAVWTPGSYLVREYARHIDSMKMTDGKRNEVEYEKTRKNRWAVKTEGLEQLVVSYRLYCNEMSVRTNWVGREFAILNGAPTFLTVVDRLDLPHRVVLELPRNWKRSATSLKSTGAEPHAFVADDFDELVDSPIVAGNINIYPFEAGGVTHQLVNIGEAGYWGGDEAATDLAKVVSAHQDMWGSVPYDRYLFLNVIGAGGGGLEHDNSTLMMTSRWSFRDKTSYKNWLSLASHEFFHTWNVRRLRPKGLVKYDYENETYTRGLWVAEGVTSYYEDVLLARAGLISHNEYLKRLNSNIGSVQKTAGRKVQSLSESSYDTWIKFYRSDENSSNTRISYYSKGAVAAFLLDAEIQKRTDGKKSLDDVMRTLYEKHLEDGYDSDDFRSIVDDVAGEDLSAWFASAIDSTDELDYENAKEWFGLRFPGDPKEQDANETSKKDEVNAETESGDGAESEDDTADEEAPSKGNDESAKPKKKKPWLGFSGTSRVSRVVANSPATDAGINTGDEILAINGFRVTGTIDSRLKQYQVGDELDLLVSRRGKVFELQLTIGVKDETSWKLSFLTKPTDDQKSRRESWLGEKE